MNRGLSINGKVKTLQMPSERKTVPKHFGVLPKTVQDTTRSRTLLEGQHSASDKLQRYHFTAELAREKVNNAPIRWILLMCKM